MLCFPLCWKLEATQRCGSPQRNAAYCGRDLSKTFSLFLWSVHFTEVGKCPTIPKPKAVKLAAIMKKEIWKIPNHKSDMAKWWCMSQIQLYPAASGKNKVTGIDFCGVPLKNKISIVSLVLKKIEWLDGWRITQSECAAKPDTERIKVLLSTLWISFQFFFPNKNGSGEKHHSFLTPITKGVRI